MERPSPKLPERAIHGPDQLRQGIERLQRQIGKLEAFDPSSVSVRNAAETRAMQAAIAESLAKTFGDGTSEYNRYASAARLDHAPNYISGRPPVALIAEWIQDGKAKSLALLNQAVKDLQEELAERGENTTEPAPSEPTSHDLYRAEREKERTVKTKTQEPKETGILKAEGEGRQINNE
jgi:polyhydroxyalkanoate synthesis regulator phasin